MDKQKIIYTVIGIAGIVIFLVGAYFATNQNSPTQAEDDTFYAEAATIKETDQTKWATDSAVVLTEYSDLQCPACASFHPIINALSQDPEITQNATFIYRHFPLVTIHKNALAASYASEAAGNQGQFYEMVDILFERQADWENANNAREIFTGYAQELGLDTAQFEQDMESDAVVQKVQADQQSGTAVGVAGTPTFYLNGRRVRPGSVEEFSALIKEAIANNPGSAAESTPEAGIEGDGTMEQTEVQQ